MSDESQPDVAAEVAVAINQLDPYQGEKQKLSDEIVLDRKCLQGP